MKGLFIEPVYFEGVLLLPFQKHTTVFYCPIPATATLFHSAREILVTYKVQKFTCQCTPYQGAENLKPANSKQIKPMSSFIRLHQVLFRALVFSLLITLSFQLSAQGADPGNTKVTVLFSNTSIEQVLKSITRQTRLQFIYRNADVDHHRKVNVNFTQQPLDDVLKFLFADKGLSWVYLGKMVKIGFKDMHAIDKKTTPDSFIIEEDSIPSRVITGKITNRVGNPVDGASVIVKGTRNGTVSNVNGEFILKGVKPQAILLISSIGFEAKEISLNGSNNMDVILDVLVKTILPVEVVSTGYQDIPKERATGSFNKVNNELFSRRVSTNIIDRIENITPGLSFETPSESSPQNPNGILIRGRSTIFSSTAPLIVVDNFPYDGSLSNINPNDVESITILKDAAAASIWGARSGNGVIVITTKRGKSEKAQIEFNTNTAIQSAPDIFNVNTITSPDYIELERYLFDKGFYALDEQYNQLGVPRPFTPVVDLLIAKRDGKISATEADTQIESFKDYDARSDIKKYLYRNSISQQHSINVSGATSNLNYYLSGGWDHNIGSGNFVGGEFNRVTLKAQNSFKLTSRLQIDAGLNFTQSDNKNGNNYGMGLNTGNKGLYPYARLIDDQGNPLDLVYNNRKIFTDTAIGSGNLSDWKYYPINDIGNTEHSTKTKDYLVNVGIKYQILKSLNIQLKYQYESSINTLNSLYGEDSYMARNLSNSFFQPNALNKFPVPVGGILDVHTGEIISHQGRTQLNYNKTFHQKHQIAAIVGWEIKDVTTKSSANRFYGYKKQGSLVSPAIDYVNSYVKYNDKFNSGYIPSGQDIGQTLDRFISYFANASYTYDNRYIISLSGRNDAANLFGVSTNQKGVPLWSGGFAWQASNENFYNIGWLPYLKVRATYGYNGNFSRTASALSTITFSTLSNINLVNATIQNPPNRDLRWEQVRIFNLGVDYATKNQRITGTIEYYKKHATDLIAPAPVDPTLGFIAPVYQNVASMKGSGFELELNSKNIEGKFKWHSTFIFSNTFSKITKYLIPVSNNGSVYLNSGSSVDPVIGKPVYTIYSYYWAGLDPETGDPQGYIGKEVSNDWAAIRSNTSLDSLKYNGPVQPTYFGALRNSFEFKNISISFNISYKFGYYFRRPSVVYSGLLNNWTGHGDYANRWKNPGDEIITNVPSFVYPANGNRESFYSNSEILVEKGDHIRLEDLRIDYLIDKSTIRQLPFKQINLYIYARNLGILWVENEDGIDPYFNNTPIVGKSVALGMNLIF